MSEKPPRTFEEESPFPHRALSVEACTHESVTEVLSMAAAKYEKERADFTIDERAFERLLVELRKASVFTLYSSLYSMLFNDTYTQEAQSRMERKNVLVVRLATTQALTEKLGEQNLE